MSVLDRVGKILELARTTRYPLKIDVLKILDGDPNEFLHIFQFAIVKFSKLLTLYLTHEHYLPSQDLICTIFDIIYHLFQFSHNVCPDSFVEMGNAEAKMDMVIAFLQSCIAWHSKLYAEKIESYPHYSPSCLPSSGKISRCNSK